MKMSRFVPLIGLACVAAGCTSSTPSESQSRGSGSLALSADDSELYVADHDNDQVIIFDTKTEKARARVDVGRWPQRVAVGSDGLVYVTNRHDRSVSVIDPKEAKEVGRIAVGAEPTGLAITDDGQQLLVTNFSSQTISVVDLVTRAEIRTIPAGIDPIGIAIAPGGKAYVTHTRGTDVTLVDIDRAAPVGKIGLSLDTSKTLGEKRIPGQAIDPVVGLEDGRVYVAHVQSKEDPVPTTIDNPDAYAGGGGNGGGGQVTVVANALATIDVANDVVLAAPGLGGGRFDCFDCGMPQEPANGVPAAIMTSNGQALSGPSSAALEPGGQWLFVTNLHSNNVSFIATRPDGVALPAVKVGRGPNGIAIARDAKKAYVYNSFDYSISVLEADGSALRARPAIKIATTPLTPVQEVGRALFFSAEDRRMTNPAAGGIACASCHPNGREDGRTWKFSEGLRNTPTLAGRDLKNNAPYHWDGLLTDMHAFKLVVETRMGGTGTQRDFDGGASLSEDDFNAMLAFLDVLPSPDNPHKGEMQTDAQARGQEIFENKAACATCHTGVDLTDNKLHLDFPTVSFEEKFPNGINTPPLRNLFASAPYLHDGSAPTLKARVMVNPGDKHGTTSTLSPAEVDDLVEYLQTL